MLQKHLHFNDFSDELRKEFEEKAKSLGKKVRFKFNISKPNPDPQKYNGETVWPGMYTLNPRTFRITDEYEKRVGVSKSKEVGLVDKVDREGRPESFHRIRVYDRERGIKEFTLVDSDGRENYEELEYVVFLLMHPKLQGGKFQDKSKASTFELIDEKANAKSGRDRRGAKAKALAVAVEMNEQKAREFADAMLWDSTEDFDVLKNKIEELAETTPEFFNDLVNGKNMEYQALVKRAMDKKVISFDPAEHKIIWASNLQTITMLAPGSEKNEVVQFAEWLMVEGKRGEDTYKKIKGLVSQN